MVASAVNSGDGQTGLCVAPSTSTAQNSPAISFSPAISCIFLPAKSEFRVLAGKSLTHIFGDKNKY